MDCKLINKQLFALPRSGIADSIPVDNYGRVWAAECNGIVIRNARRKELCVFDVETLIDAASYPISNFAGRRQGGYIGWGSAICFTVGPEGHYSRDEWLGSSNPMAPVSLLNYLRSCWMLQTTLA